MNSKSSNGWVGNKITDEMIQDGQIRWRRRKGGEMADDINL